MPDGFSGQVGSTVSWLAVRLEPYRDAASDPATSSDGLHLIQPGPLLGVICLMFAVGPEALAWSERLASSDWYGAMRPRPADLTDGGVASGRATLTAGEIAARFPEARLATVALMDNATRADTEAALNLVQALISGSGQSNQRLRVIVTLSSMQTERFAIVPRCQQLGAVVIRGTVGLEADHLHHFPLRAMLQPPSGRLVCVDLADCLMFWPRGRVGDLHLVPFNSERAERALRDITLPRRLITATLIVHFPEKGPDSSLVAVDALANLCGAFFFGSYEEATMLFTSGDRLDGVTGTADLLLVHDGP